MTLLYLTNARIPTEKAHGVQIVKMCEAFQEAGFEVELLVPTRRQSQAMQQVRDLWAHYDVRHPFRIRYVPTPDFLRFERMLPPRIMHGLYYLQCFLFSLFAIGLTAFQRDSLYYSRSLQTLFLLGSTRWLHRKRIYFEAHELHGDPRHAGLLRKFLTALMRWMLRRIDGLIVISHRLRTLYIEMGMPVHRILVAPDGVERQRLEHVSDKRDARRVLQISLDRIVVCYTGHLFRWKGVYTLTECMALLPDTYLLYIVGGLEADIRSLREFIEQRGIRNVVLTGYVPYAEIPRYLSAADVLVLPNSAHSSNSREYTSPLKLFEYMGARRPIVASDLPSLREILRHGDNAYLVAPDDPQHLAAGIQHMVQQPDLAQQMVNAAYADVHNYTWETRAQKIRAFFETGGKDSE
jgi:glycosyltransferase involved in cell wall biosynthesis